LAGPTFAAPLKDVVVEITQFPEAFSSMAIGLGAPRRYFPVKRMQRAGNLVFFFILLGGAILVFLYGLYIAYIAYQKHGLAMIDDTLTAPGIIAFILLLLGLAAGWSAYTNWNKGVTVYERGFAIRDRRGVRTWRWEDIISLTASVTRHYTNGIYTGTTHIYSLYDRQDQRLVLSDIYVKVEELAKAIQDSIFPILYERIAQQYNAGERLVFGPVVISKDGIQIGKKAYPWADVRQVAVQKGILKVSKKDGGWFSGASVLASAIPNLNVLLNLIYQVVGLKTG
jgi:hypothetical protein